MVIAAGGWPPLTLILFTLLGGTLSAAGANTLNCVYDADIDLQMRRTRSRPMARHEVSPEKATIFGIALGVAGFVVLWWTSNLLAAVLSTSALLFYVFVYTMWLKRRTPQNIVIGGAAGAAPALVGWAAVTGSLSVTPWILFLIVFYWTPPHFWALAVRYKDDYARAGVPMLPVTDGVSVTTRRMLLYTGLMVGASLLLVPLGGLRWVYLIAAVVLGGWFLVDTWLVYRDPSRTMRLFTTSTIYLAALFGAALVDVVLR